MSTLGNRIKLLRGKQSQTAFAALFEIPQVTLGNYERDRNEPRFELIHKICTHFEINVEWLLFGTGPMHPTEIASDPQQGMEQLAVPTIAAGQCSRCVELEKELDKKSQHIEEINNKFIEALQSNMLLTEKNGELRLENLKLTHKLDMGKQMCREYEKIIKEAGIIDQIFDELQNIPSSDPPHIR